MESKQQLTVSKIGKMSQWHKNLTLMGVLLSVGSGLVWFISEDMLGQPIQALGLLISMHGIVGHLFLLILGMAMYHHVQLSLRMKKNVWMGSAFIVTSFMLIASILALFYGRGVIHEQAHLLHLVSGSLTGIVFFLHIQIGKKSFPQAVLKVSQQQKVA
jgi:hypothetical protein